ncbi:hypothetical protein BN1318_150008 [Staphylococcus capitis]|nr:hypothetical protein BN1318_150008 [Staphylococcus capitis]
MKTHLYKDSFAIPHLFIKNDYESSEETIIEVSIINVQPSKVFLEWLFYV